MPRFVEILSTASSLIARFCYDPKSIRFPVMFPMIWTISIEMTCALHVLDPLCVDFVIHLQYEFLLHIESSLTSQFA